MKRIFNFKNKNEKDRAIFWGSYFIFLLITLIIIIIIIENC